MSDNQSFCDQCISGHVHAHAPKGEDKTILGVFTYVTKPASSTHAAVILSSDAFGLGIPNSRLIADKIAEHGFLVMVPDILQGDPVPGEIMTLMEIPDTSTDPAHQPLLEKKNQWKSKWPIWAASHPPSHATEVIENFIDQLKSEGITHIGVIGYCYGAKPTVTIAGKENRINAFAVAHPSLLNQDDIKNIKTPGLFLCAEHDPVFPVNGLRKEAEEILKAKGVENVFVDYPGTSHGFGIRADDNNPVYSAAAKDATARAILFFKKHLGVQ